MNNGSFAARSGKAAVPTLAYWIELCALEEKMMVLLRTNDSGSSRSKSQKVIGLVWLVFAMLLRQ
jgi:hypothetical protein